MTNKEDFEKCKTCNGSGEIIGGHSQYDGVGGEKYYVRCPEKDCIKGKRIPPANKTPIELLNRLLPF